MTISGTTVTAYTVRPGMLSLTPGQQYVLLFTTTNFPGPNGSSQYAALNNNTQYAGGQFVFLNNGFAGLGSLTASSWSFFNEDLAFAATFGLPYFSLVGLTFNQAAAATALNNQIEKSGDLPPEFFDLFLQSRSELAGSLTQLSGDAYANISSTTFADASLVRNSVLSYLRFGQNFGFDGPGGFEPARTVYAMESADLPGGKARPVAMEIPAQFRGASPYSIWGEALGARGWTDGNANVAKIDRSTGGFIIGGDVGFDWLGGETRMGVAGGYTRTNFDMDSRLASGNVNGVFGSLYGATSFGNINLRLGTSYTNNDIEMSRAVLVPGLSSAFKTKLDGFTAQAFGEAGYRLNYGALQIEPFAGLAVVRLHTDSFNEIGGPAALYGASQDRTIPTSTIGAHVAAKLGTSLPLTARATLGWQHAFGDVDGKALLGFRAIGSAFTVQGVPIARDSLIAEARLDWQISGQLRAGLAYTGAIAKDNQDHALKARMDVRF
jgi:outer membrane autotransporter protein